jgi:hypothetical protein
VFRQSPGAALGMLADRIGSNVHKLITLDRLDVFVCTRAPLFTFESSPKFECRPLTEEDFSQMRERNDRFGEHAKLYHDLRGINSAFGVFVDGDLGHISWAYTSAEYQLEPYERFRLGNGEAEIVNCFTSDAYRGKGLYPHAVRVIASSLLANGFDRVFMCIAPENEASRRGILKAGLTNCGHVVHLRSPAITKWRGWYWPQDQSKVALPQPDV